MASFTIADIELIRRKSGISYEEAVALLDYHNGNVARALIDLERNGKLKEPVAGSDPAEPRRSKAGRFFQRLLRTRVIVRRDEGLILNLSAVTVGLAAVFCPYLVVASLIVGLVLGCRIHIDRPDAGETSLESMVGQAARTVTETVVEGVKNTVADVTRGMSDAARQPQQAEKQVCADPEPAAAPAADEGPAVSPAEIIRDIEEHERAKEDAAPVIQMPVRVDTADGSVSVTRDSQGYNTATIE